MHKSLLSAKRNAIYHPIARTQFIDLPELERKTQATKDWVENYQIYDKIADVVPPHLKTNKEPVIIADCVAKNSEFHDPEFPHDHRTLVDPKGIHKHKGWETLTWKSARELFKNQPFFVFNGISPQDVKQQAIADCYLLGALACLATQPGLVRRLFDIEEPNEWGVYCIWLNINGQWKEYAIDDYFPVNRGGAPVFARPTQGQNEIWVMLIEKAYAKAYGGYYKIGLGRAGEAFRDLTGAPSDTYEMEEARKDSQKREMIWNKIVSGFKNCYLLAASSLHTGAGYEQKQDNGIMTDHVYSILDVQEIMDSRGRAARILQMRNPWGAVEWKGDWADNSPLWTTEARSKLMAYEDDEEDGLFWMDYFDFCENFSLLFINKVEPTFTYNSVKVPLKQSKNNHSFKFYRRIVKVGVRTPGNYTFSIDKKDIHYTNDIGEILGLSTITVARIDPEGVVKFVKAASNPYRNTHVRTFMDTGKYIAIIEVFYPDNIVQLFDRSEMRNTWRDVVFSTYGPSTCGIHLFTLEECNSLPLDPAAYLQYRAWRSFFRNPPEDLHTYYKDNRVPEKNIGTADVLLENGQVVAISYEKTSVLGLYFYIFRNNSGKNIEFDLKINTLEGYELICRDGAINKSTNPPGRISIPDKSLDILVMRPIDEQAKHGSVFVNGRYYPEMNRESKREAETHEYLMTKKMYLDEADVEKFPEIKKSQPKVLRELIRGIPNNVKKGDPTDITMRKRYRNTTNRDDVMDMGNSQLVTKYSNPGTNQFKGYPSKFNALEFLNLKRAGNTINSRSTTPGGGGKYRNSNTVTNNFFGESVNRRTTLKAKDNYVQVSGKNNLDLTKVERSVSRPRRSFERNDSKLIREDLRGVGSPNPHAGDFYTRLLQEKNKQQLMNNRTVTPNKYYGNQVDSKPRETITNITAHNHRVPEGNLFKTPRKHEAGRWRQIEVNSEKTKVPEFQYQENRRETMTETVKKHHNIGNYWDGRSSKHRDQSVSRKREERRESGSPNFYGMTHEQRETLDRRREHNPQKHSRVQDSRHRGRSTIDDRDRRGGYWGERDMGREWVVVRDRQGMRSNERRKNLHFREGDHEYAGRREDPYHDRGRKKRRLANFY